MNLGSVETFSGLDHMVVAMLTVIMVLYGGECMRGDMCAMRAALSDSLVCGRLVL